MCKQCDGPKVKEGRRASELGHIIEGEADHAHDRYDVDSPCQPLEDHFGAVHVGHFLSPCLAVF